jgi:hypothetical protein
MSRPLSLMSLMCRVILYQPVFNNRVPPEKSRWPEIHFKNYSEALTKRQILRKMTRHISRNEKKII